MSSNVSRAIDDLKQYSVPLWFGNTYNMITYTVNSLTLYTMLASLPLVPSFRGLSESMLTLKRMDQHTE